MDTQSQPKPGQHHVAANAESNWLPFETVEHDDKSASWFRTFIIYDSLTGLPLTGSPLTLSLKDHATKDKWPTYVREQLIASALGNYLRLGTTECVDGEFGDEATLRFWRAERPIRIQMDGFTPYKWQPALLDVSGHATTVKAMIGTLPCPEGGVGNNAVRFTLRDRTSKALIKTWNHDLAYTTAENDELLRIDSIASTIKDNASINCLFAKLTAAWPVKKDEEKAEWHLFFPNVLNLELVAHPASVALPEKKPADWIPYEAVEKEQKEADWLRTFIIHDDVTGLPLPGSPLSFPLNDHATPDKWPAFVRKQLLASPLGNYLRLGTQAGVDGTFGDEETVTFWRINKPIRIQMNGFTTLGWQSALHNGSGQAITVKAMMEAFSPPPKGQTAHQSVTFTLRDKTTQSPIKSWNHSIAFTGAKDDELLRIDSIVNTVNDNLPINVLFAKLTNDWPVKKAEEKAEWHLLLPDDLNLELDARITVPVAASHPWWGDTGSDLDNDVLPAMTGFEPGRLGAGEHAWYSTGYLLADRDLVKGEQVRVWLVNEQDGRVIRQVAWKATADKLGKTAWPKAFLDKVNATPVDKDGSKWICAGHLDENTGNLLVAENGSPTSTAFAALAANQKTELDRLWYYGAGCRLFTNAPFAANRAIAARVPDILPPEGESVVVQVRDRTSLHLYETHLYTPAAGDDSPLGDWSKAMCKAINGHHGMLQAGVLGDDKVTIAPATIANALWVPQNSNLSVELESLSWQKYRAVAAFAPKAGDVVQFLLYDRYSGAQLPGSPFSYTIKPTDTDAATCLASMAKALNKTSLGDYLRLGGAQALDSTPTTAEGWALWFMPLPVRVIVMGVPGLAGSNERALQTPEGQALTLSGLYEAYKEGVTLTLQDRWTGNALESHDYKPTEEGKKSSAKWLAALKKQLVSPMTLWGSNTQLGSAKNEAKNEDENTLCLPHEIACVWIARPLNDDVEPANSNSFYINSRLVYKRDYLVWREAKRFAHSHRFPIGSRHEHTFAKILAWNDEVLNERDLVELFHVSDQGPKPQKDVTSEEFQFLAPSANIPALTASALAQNNNYELPLNDTWNLQYPGHYWGRCLSCTESQVIIDFGLLNLEWLRFSDLLKFLMHCRKNKPSIIDILTNAELFKPYTYKNLCQLRSLNILTPDDIELINKMELNPTSRLDKHLLQRVRSAFNINEFAIYPTELFRDFPYFAKYIDDSTRKQLFEEACAIGSEYDLFKSITSIIQKSLEGHTLNDDLKAHLKELGVVSETHALSVLHKATHKEKSKKHYAITLASRAIAKGIRFTTCTSQLPPDAPPFLYNRSSGLGLGIKIYIPSGVTIERDDILCGASHLSKSGVEGDGVFRIDQPFRGKVFKPKDSLCADYAGTLGSEVYDVSGANENGVDPKTGLFHAHYPVGVIRGLEGKGPEVDLTLHYSATRANESALGDGWAFRFSAYDNRLHRLTLSTGQTITLTADHVKKATGKQHLAINGVTLTGCKGKYDALTEITIVFPSGRVEKLAKPGTHDGKEASEHYKKAFVEKVDKLLENLQKWLKETGVTNEQIENINKKIKDLKAMKKDMDRKAFILVPQSITSPQGGTLTFAWEGKEGHIHLQSIKDGDTQLLKGTLGTPVATGKYTSTFTVWPDSVEAYDVTLTIEDCLLTRLTRQGANDPSPVQTVVFGYDGEPVLDRVLCSVAEEDGSLEAVSYAPQWRDWDTSSASPIPLSRVLRHTLQPGAGQESITHIWQWEGINNYAMQEGETFSSTCSLDTDGAAMGPFTRRTWALKNGFAVPTEVVEEVPGVVRETTTMTYPDSIASEDPTVKFRLATQPIRTTVSTEDLRTPRTPAPTSAAEPSAQESQS